jgi:hypothetical protein
MSRWSQVPYKLSDSKLHIASGMRSLDPRDWMASLECFEKMIDRDLSPELSTMLRLGGARSHTLTYLRDDCLRGLVISNCSGKRVGLVLPRDKGEMEAFLVSWNIWRGRKLRLPSNCSLSIEGLYYHEEWPFDPKEAWVRKVG